MKKNNAIKSIVGVMFSNITTIISGVIVGFLIPKILTVDGYGYYKTFTLYVSYLGLFSLGIADGIVLKYGGDDYDQLDRKLFRGYFKWYLLIHCFFALIMAGIALLFGDEHFTFILVMIAINMIGLNVTGYYQQLSQITQRFKEYSFRKVLQSIISILIVLFMFMLYKIQGGSVRYELYVVMIVSMNLILGIWYCFTYKDLSFGKGLSFGLTRKHLFQLVKDGFPLLVANLCSTLILTIDRQFVSLCYEVSEYAVYAFAYNLLALITVATSAVSTVMYPMMKRTNEGNLSSYYGNLVSIISVFVYGAIIVFYPLQAFIEWYLPKYSDSIPIFRVILPGLVFSSVITVVMHNYYKVYNLSFMYFVKNLIVLIISCVLNVAAQILFHSMESISWASIITMVLWYCYVERTLTGRYGLKCVRNVVYIMLQGLVFYIVTGLFQGIIGAVIYCVEFVIVSWIFNKKAITDFVRVIKPSNKKEEEAK